MYVSISVIPYKQQLGRMANPMPAVTLGEVQIRDTVQAVSVFMSILV